MRKPTLEELGLPPGFPGISNTQNFKKHSETYSDKDDILGPLRLEKITVYKGKESVPFEREWIVKILYDLAFKDVRNYQSNRPRNLRDKKSDRQTSKKSKGAINKVIKKVCRSKKRCS